MTASPAPLRSRCPSRSTPLIRVWAVNGTNSACRLAMSCSRMPYCLASTTIERPSGVSSASDASCATSASSASDTPGIGTNSDASRLPIVIVPVLSSSSTSTSPDASTARPESASTLRRTSRSMPAMPIADSSAPIVVGINATSRLISVVSEIAGAREQAERPQRGDDDHEDQRQPGEQDVRARSRSGSCAARRPRPARSCGPGTSALAPA